MGWTSYTYRESTHTKWTVQLDREFAHKAFNSHGYEILKFSFHKAISAHHHHELYLVVKHPENYNFLLVVIVDIIDEEIYFKEICATMGPGYYNCPPEFMEPLPEPRTDYKSEWRRKVLGRSKAPLQ